MSDSKVFAKWIAACATAWSVDMTSCDSQNSKTAYQTDYSCGCEDGLNVKPGPSLSDCDCLLDDETSLLHCERMKNHLESKYVTTLAKI